MHDRVDSPRDEPLLPVARRLDPGSSINSEFRDVVFEDVVCDNNRFYLIPQSYVIYMGSHNYYYQTPHPQTPHP